MRRLHEESGISRLEWLGLLGAAVLVLGMIPFVHQTVANLVGLVLNQRDPATGEVTAFSQMMRGIGITIGAVLVFVGAGWLVLSTNLGNRLALLVVGAALSGWMTISGILFIVFAPRGIRPADLEGLNAVQMRVPAIGMALGSLILFVMFVLALDRYEREQPV